MLLVAGSAAGIITMGLHPVAPYGGGLPSPHEMTMLVLLNRFVHGLGIASLPMIFLGALVLTRRLMGNNRLPLAALVVYGLAAVAIMIAGSMSGFVGSDLLSRLAVGDPKLEMRQMFLEYTFRINQAFAAVYVVGCCFAVFLWSLAIVRTRLMPVGLGIYGLVLAPVLIGALFSGNLALNVHGFGLVMLTQSLWFIIAGTMLMRVDREDEQIPKSVQLGSTGTMAGRAL